MYTCPMHPEVMQHKPGFCPKCHMKLVEKSALETTTDTRNSYTPLIIIFNLLLLVTLVLTYKDVTLGNVSFPKTISYFMIGFFLIFSGFKILDLKGFAEGYGTYDLLAKKWYGYGYLYPFLELFFGLSMILFPFSHLIVWSEVVVMIFSGLGVTIKLLKKEKFHCACLGTFLKVPLTYITLIEDFGMAALGILLLLY